MFVISSSFLAFISCFVMCSGYSHSYSYGLDSYLNSRYDTVKSRTCESRDRVALVRGQLVFERHVRRLQGKDLPPGYQRSPDDFWKTLRLDKIPDNAPAMLICKALVPRSAAKRMCGWHSLKAEMHTWSDSDLVLPAYLLHYTVSA